eukprot:TRINITY_DN5727_c0_g1_i1.p1 TRINITY_DN5727_c0_g1~~TRINITY_DN5727_c0_g1_i1.p1  ORF type:complete len:103 (+),score=9.09 TRINITY_DN5727_c0_g1_i1:576-884(+)
MSEVEATLQRINGHKGVLGTIIVDAEGTVLRTTVLQPDMAAKCASLIPSLSAMARSCVRDLDPQNDLQFLRIRSKQHEILVAPDKDFTLIVIQDPTTLKEGA